jgi:hypothetical protein
MACACSSKYGMAICNRPGRASPGTSHPRPLVRAAEDCSLWKCSADSGAGIPQRSPEGRLSGVSLIRAKLLIKEQATRPAGTHCLEEYTVRGGQGQSRQWTISIRCGAFAMDCAEWIKRYSTTSERRCAMN